MCLLRRLCRPFTDNEGEGMQGRDHYGGSTFTEAGRAIRQVRVIAVDTTLYQ